MAGRRSSGRTSARPPARGRVGVPPFIRQQYGAVGCRDRKPVPACRERGCTVGGEVLEVRAERREHAELVAADAIRVTALLDGVRESGAELLEQDVTRAMAVAVVVGLEPVEVEQEEGVGGLSTEDTRKVDLQPAPVAQSRQRVGGGLDAAGGEQRVVLAEGQGHPHEHQPERGDGEAERDDVDVQRHAEREHSQREPPEPDRDEQAAAGRDGPSRGHVRSERRGPREAGDPGRHERVGDDTARVAAQLRHVDQIRHLERDDPAPSVPHKRSIRHPPRPTALTIAPSSMRSPTG